MKKLMVLIISVIMVISLLSACGNSETPQNTSGKDTASESRAPGTEPGDSVGDSAGPAQTATGDTTGDNPKAAEDADDDEAEIVLAYYVPRAISSDSLEKVQSAINEITVPQIHTSVKLIALEQGNWDQQINLMISGNEQLDLLPTFFYGSTAISSLTSQKQLKPLDELLEEYGKDILKTLPEGYLGTTTYDGSIYAVPVNKDNVGGTYWCVRKDILEQLNLLEDAQNASSMQDVEAILKAVKENTDLVPLVPASTSGVLNFTYMFTDGAFSDAVKFDDFLGGYIGTMSTDPDKIVCLYDTEAFKTASRMLQKWFEAGYIYADAATDDQQPEEYVKSDIAFSFFNGGEESTQGTKDCGHEMLYIKVCDRPISTGSANMITWTIPVTSREPEAAMKFLNMMYTDSRIIDLFNYGIENDDYVVGDDGRYSFPEGKDSGSVGYYSSYTWLFGNQFLAGVWDNLDPDIREKALKTNADAGLSDNFGFVANTVGLDTEIAAMTSAKNEFVRGLNCGVGDADANIDALMKKMKAAGVDDVIANVQTQLDDWKAAQN